MSTRTGPRFHEILAILLMISISMTGLALQGPVYSDSPSSSGQIIPMAAAMETGPLEKEVGQSVHFKVKIQNNGQLETTYIIVTKWRLHGTEEWESCGFEDLRLLSGQLETMIVGYVECTEWMVEKYFDVKFLLYEAETERLLDEKYVDKAWYVKEVTILGTIAGYWIE